MTLMKIPVVNKYLFINILLYMMIIMSLSIIFSLNSFIGSNFGYIWIIFVVCGALINIVIPIILSFAVLEILLFKLNILKYKNLTVNVNSKIQKIIYTLAVMSSIYYLWFKIYYEPILDKMLQFD